MVHALSEIWRILTPNGVLVDLRPMSSQCPIEVVTGEKNVEVGRVDATGAASDDAAADRAIQRVVDDEWFVLRQDARFDFEFYWDTVNEMKSFMEDSKRMKQVFPSYPELEKIHRDQNRVSRGRGARLRCTRRMKLVTYHKLAQPGHRS